MTVTWYKLCYMVHATPQLPWISLVVADGWTHIWHQAICNNHDDIGWSPRFPIVMSAVMVSACVWKGIPICQGIAHNRPESGNLSRTHTCPLAPSNTSIQYHYSCVRYLNFLPSARLIFDYWFSLPISIKMTIANFIFQHRKFVVSLWIVH